MHLRPRFLLLFLLGWACRFLTAGSGPLRTVADIPLPGASSRFDYACLDPGAHRLYLNHMGAGEVVVFDTANRKVIRVLKGFPRCTGVLVVPSRHELYVSAPGEGAVAVLDTTTLKEIARIKVGEFPDGIAFDPDDQRVFVSDESGCQVAVIDARAHRLLSRIPMGGEVGNTQYDPASRRIYSNVQTLNQLVAMDPRTLKVVDRIPLPGAEGNHGLLIDAEHHLAFAACEGNAVLLVVDLKTRKVTASFPVGRGPDVLAFDPGSGRLVVASESGPAAIFQEEGGTLRRAGNQDVGRNAHVVAIDPVTHLLYFPLMRLGLRPGLRIMAPSD